MDSTYLVCTYKLYNLIMGENDDNLDYNKSMALANGLISCHAALRQAVIDLRRRFFCQGLMKTLANWQISVLYSSEAHWIASEKRPSKAKPLPRAKLI